MNRDRRRALLSGLVGLAGAGLFPGEAPAVGRAAARTPVAPPRPIPPELLRLAGTCVISGFYGGRLPPELSSLLAQGALGGIIIAGNNFHTRDQLRGLCASITATAPADARPIVAADQEGGPVAHLSPPLGNVPSMTVLGTIDDEELTHRVGASIGADLRGVGVNMDLAPVLDVRTSPRNTVVLNRVFGRDPAKVARHGLALIEGLRSAGVLPCAKHFPGHGDTALDSHAGLPRVPHGVERLDSVELVPFRACAQATPAVMLAHVVYAGVDPQRPASLSRPIIEGVLRDRVGFTGVAMTDDLQMQAITRTMPLTQAAETSIRAGADMVMIAHTSTYAAAIVRHLAARAEGDTALRERLEQAAGRVRAMRRELTTALPPNPFIASTADVSAEVLRRASQRGGAAARGANAGPGRDPTLRR